MIRLDRLLRYFIQPKNNYSLLISFSVCAKSSEQNKSLPLSGISDSILKMLKFFIVPF